MTSMLDKSSPLPLYHQLRNDLLIRIENKEWGVDQKLPTEDALATHYSVSKITVRQAMQDLAAAGTVRREQGRGTFVNAKRSDTQSPALLSFTEESRLFGLTAGSEVMSAGVLPATREVAEQLSIREGQEVFKLERKRTRGRWPVGLQTAYISLQLAPDLPQQKFENVSLYEILEQEYNLKPVRAVETHSAISLEGLDAHCLEVKPGTAAMCTKRTTFQEDGTPLQYTVSLLRGDRYEITIDLLRRVLPLLLLLFVFFAPAAQAKEPGDFLPISVWYGGGKARAPMLEADPLAKKEIWRKDLKQIKALGFNTVRCWIDWASGEPAEGQYRFDTIDVILKLAEEEGLRVFVQVYMDSAPDWVGRKYRDALFVSSNGQALQPESSPGYCLDHPGVRKADLGFYSALAQRASKSKAFLGWDLWSEPHVINWATPTYIYNPEFCFCTNTVARFRTWLQKKYGSLETLNTAWYRHFSNWQEVTPNKLSTILSFTDYIDWKTFIQDKLSEDLRARYEAVKKTAPEHVATSHAAGVGLFASPHHWEGQSDDWKMASQVDYYGTSFYPKHSYNVDRDVEWRGALLDFTRSFGFANGRRGFYVGELQAGFGTIAYNVGSTVTPADLRLWTWSAIARGAKGIHYYAWYPMSSGYESGGFGMIQLDGTLTERSREAGAIAKVLDQHQKLLLDARPVRAQVAVVYNPLSHFVGGRQRAAISSGPQGEVAGMERDSMLGIYRALFPSNVPIDFVHVNELTAASLAQYKMIFLPYPLMLPERVGKELAGYVRNGGALIAEARAGWNDERGLASARIPGMGLDEVFGCRESCRAIRAGTQDAHSLGRWLRIQRAYFRGDARTAAGSGTHRGAVSEWRSGGGEFDIWQRKNTRARIVYQCRV